MKGRLRLLVFCLLSGGAFAQITPPPAPDPLEDINVAIPSQPGGGANPPPATTPVSDPWTTLEGMLARIQGLQKQSLDGIQTYKNAKDEAERTMTMRDIQVWHGTVEGMLLSSTWKETVEKVRKTDDLAKTKDARYLGMFADTGHLAMVDRNQEIIRAFLKDPLAPATTGVTATAAAAPGSVADIQGQIDRVSLELARPGLTEQRRGELEAERTRLVERIRSIAGSGDTGSTAPSASGDGHAAGAPGSTPSAGSTGSTGSSASTGSTGSTGATGSTGSTVDSGSAQAASVPLVPNSYGVVPQVLTDAEIRAALDPLIEKELAQVNAKSGDSLKMNKYRQMVGSSGKTTVKSIGRPDYDHYREWLRASPALKGEIDRHAQAIYTEKARALAPRPTAPPAAGGGGVDLPSSSGRDR